MPAALPVLAEEIAIYVVRKQCDKSWALLTAAVAVMMDDRIKLGRVRATAQQCIHLIEEHHPNEYEELLHDLRNIEMSLT